MDSHSLIYWPEMILVQLNRISLIVKWLHFPCPAISVDLQVANESFPQRLWMEEEQICGKPAFCNALGTMPGCLFTPTLSPHQNKTKWSVFPISPGYYSRPKRNWRQCWDKILKAWLLAADREMSPPFSPKQTLLRGEGEGGQGSTFCHPPKERPLNWGWCKKKKNKSESKRKMSLLVSTCYFWFVKIIK